MNTSSAASIGPILEAIRLEGLQTVVHDLRSPMTVIKGNLQILLSGYLGAMTEEQQLLLKRSVGPLEDLIHMTENILQAGMLEREDIQLQRSSCDLDRLLSEMIEFYSTPFEQRHMRIFRDGNTVGMALQVDSFWIKRVLHNLIWNAFKYTPDQGQVRLRVSHDSQGLELTIEDTGPGIPSEKMEVIFNKFEQCRPKDRKLGSGLGLWICKRVLELHGGSIRAESTEGKGSRFILHFPPNCIL